MAKNTNAEANVTHAEAAAELMGDMEVPMGESMDGQEGEDAQIGDFDLSTDVKMDPVAPQGTYQGNVTEVKLDMKNAQLVFIITLEGNGGVLSDGETPVDGYQFRYRIFLPKQSDKGQLTKGGKDRFQWKVNNMAKCLNAMKISVNRLPEIEQAIQNADWIGLRVQCELTVDPYNGELQNNAKKVIAI